jgi:DNA-binding SARP family transcriptional activator
MEFRILGPLEVLEEGRSLPLGGPRQRAVLAVLLLHANEVVSSERLIDELWAEEPPKTADATLRVYVSQLRKVLEPRGSATGGRHFLESRAGGYVVRLGADDLDLARFERLFEQGREALAAGDAAAAAATLRDGLAVWRGKALSDRSSARSGRSTCPPRRTSSHLHSRPLGARSSSSPSTSGISTTWLPSSSRSAGSRRGRSSSRG